MAHLVSHLFLNLASLNHHHQTPHDKQWAGGSLQQANLHCHLGASALMTHWANFRVLLRKTLNFPLQPQRTIQLLFLQTCNHVFPSATTKSSKTYSATSTLLNMNIAAIKAEGNKASRSLFWWCWEERQIWIKMFPYRPLEPQKYLGPKGEEDTLTWRGHLLDPDI